MFAAQQSRAQPCRPPGAPPMLLARIRWLRCAPWRLRLPATLGGGAAGPLPARAKRGTASNAPSGVDQLAGQGGAAPETPESAAVVPDLSLHVPSGEQWQPAALPQRWLAFSDLHVSHKTRATALAVLERVHEEAARRDAGILFLGDFWHTRGTLPVEPLNEVVQQLAAWQQPMLMLPGNHDQVSLGGLVHALTPLAASNPAIHAFDGPCMFLDALWLPYRRDPAALEAALAAAMDGPAPLRAVFAHTDILGAMMNEAYQAHDGLPPELFPPDIPTYTGHYHKPHTVAGTRITYIGSPYQVTRAEAGQRKRLLLLDRSAGWEAVDHLPLDIGPRYFVAAAARPAESVEAAAAAAVEEAPVAEAAVAGQVGEAGEVGTAAAGEADAASEPHFQLELPEGLRAGDRLLLTLPTAAAKQHAKQLQKLEKQGIEVEVFTPPEAAAAPRIAAAEGMGPLQLWSEYCAWQRVPPPAAEAGAGLLRGLLAGAVDGAPLEQPHTAIEFEAVEVEGYFSFRDAVRYELGQRGLVVVTGQVYDTAEAGVESNGAGKTALMMAPLWALTGSVDSRAEGTSTARPVLADIIHDGSKKARVRVEGKVNGAPFWVERTANKKTSSVTFHLDGEDLTTQENRLTQARIDEVLGADLLGRVVFYGQSDITALLEASDRAFKQELAKLVDMHVWEAAKEASRHELGGRRDALRDAAATLRERQQQASALQEQLQGLQAAAAEWEQQAAEAAAALRREAGLLLGRVQQEQAAAEGTVAAGREGVVELEAETARLQERVQQVEAQLASEQRGAGDLEAAEQQLAEAQRRQRMLLEAQQQCSRQLGAASAAAEEAVRQQAAASKEAAAAREAASGFLRRHPHLAAGGSSSNDSSGAAGEELGELLGRQDLLSRELQQAESGLTAAREATAAQRSRLQAKQEAAQRAQREAEAAAAAVQRQQSLVQAAGAAKALSLQEVQKQRRSMQRRLATAQQRLGAAQGQARERAQQLEEYRQLLTSGGGSNGGSSGGSALDANCADQSSGESGVEVAVLAQQQEHEHSDGAAVCDRCAQPISLELFRRNVERLEAAAAAAAAKAAKEEQHIASLEQAATDLEAAAAAAEQAAQQQAALEAAEAAAAARAAEAEAASVEAGYAAVAAQECEGLAVDAQQAVDRLQTAAAQLAAANSAAEAAVALEEQRQELLGEADMSAQAEAAALQRRQQAEQQQAEAAAELSRLEAASAEAAASVASLQQQVQQLGQGQQEAVALRSQLQASAQRLRLQQQQLDALADLSEQLGTAAQELRQLCSSGSDGRDATSSAAFDSLDVISLGDLEAAATAARSTLAAAADVQQRWRLQQQQPNLPARDAALVQQQLNAAAAAVAELERRLAEVEGEVGLWKQVDDALLPRGVPNFVVEGVLGDLQAAASRNLSALTSGMTLTLNPCKPAAKRKDTPEGGTIEQIEKIVHVRQPGSLEMRQRSVRQLSGGERRRVALALALGFSELAAQRGRLRSNLIVLDEVMQHLDGEGCLRAAQLLKQLPYSSVLVVAQAHSLQTQVFDATDVVVKSGGQSIVEQGSSAAVS